MWTRLKYINSAATHRTKRYRIWIGDMHYIHMCYTTIIRISSSLPYLCVSSLICSSTTIQGTQNICITRVLCPKTIVYKVVVIPTRQTHLHFCICLKMSSKIFFIKIHYCCLIVVCSISISNIQNSIIVYYQWLIVCLSCWKSWTSDICPTTSIKFHYCCFSSISPITISNIRSSISRYC